ncbi:MAG: NAD(P)/FAD-dependent oxidoreductase, partial [Mycobacterium sp.]
MTSLWLADRANRATPPSPLLEADREADVVVVGAGITGLITAVLLARAGKSVVVLEALSAGAGATGNTTAKISLLQGTKLSKIIAKHGPNRARQYVEGNREGQDWLIGYCEAHGISVQREDAYTYAQSEQGVSSAREELEACEAVGLPAEWVDEADVPFPFHGGVRLADQAQFDPMPLLDSLIVELDERGGRLVQGVRVQKVSGEGDGLALHVRTSEADEFSVSAKQCVLATGIPILDRGGFFARLKP